MTTTSTSTTYGNTSSAQRNYTRDDLEAVNNEIALTLLPAMIVLGILMIVGILGNSLVCYIFCCRLKSGTQNFLIVCLAVFDLLSCLVAIPNEIADMRFFFDFQSVGACKIMRFITTFCAIGSILTLLVIAVDRYRKICKPFLGQLHMKHVRLSLIPIIGGATFFSWPAFIMYGLRTTETGIHGLFGQDCSTPDDVSNTIYPLLYNCVLFLCFIILAVTLIIMYTFVLRETKRHNRYLKRNSDYNIPSSNQYYSEDSHSSVEVAPGNKISSSSDSTANRTVQFAYGSNLTVETTDESAPTSEGQLVSGPIVMDASQEDHPEQLTSETAALQTTSPHNCETSTAAVSFTDSSMTSHQTTSPHDSERSTTTISFTDSFLPSQQSDDTPHDSERSTTTISFTDSFLQSQPSDDTPHSTNLPNVSKRSSLTSSTDNRKKDLRTVVFNGNLSTTNQSSIKRRNRVKSKTTMIAFLVTMVFILSFLPHLSLQVTKMIHKGFDYNLQGASLVMFNIFLRSYFINSVSNPIIYGVLNVHFSNEVKCLIRKLYRKS